VSPDQAEVVVCVVASGDADALVRCLASVHQHTPAGVPVVVCGGGDVSVPALDRPVSRAPGLAEAADGAGRADVCVLSDRTVVAEGWFDGLRDTAASDSLVGTATALSNHAAFLSVPKRNRPYRQLPQDVTLEQAAARVRARAARVRPVVPCALGHCVLVRRAAIDLAGPLDDVAALSERALRRGLRHLAADDVLVLHSPPAGAPDGPADGAADLGVLTAEARDDATGPLGRSLTLARQALTTRRVTVDGRGLGTFVAGTQVHTLELVHALARTGEVRVRALVAPGPLPDGLDDVETIATDAPAEDVERDEIVHRAFQVQWPDDLAGLTRFGERVLLTQQDLIGFRTPGYFPDAEAWETYRAVTREALAFAHLVLFTSEHAARDAVADDLVAADRARVVTIGTDHRVVGRHAEPRPPRGIDPDGPPFLLCLGTTFRHKNRPFALRLLSALRERHGWEGRLVLAGPEVADGGSAAEEAAWALAHPGDDPAVVRLGAVGEPEKAWLYAQAAAVVYPTVYEGFGFVPFEAAEAGTPALWAPQASLRDTLPADAAVLVPWDPAASADAAIGVLRDEARAAALVEAVRGRARELTWDRTAAALIEAYDEAVRLPASEAARLAEAEMVTQSAYWGLRHDIGDTGLALVGPDDPLLPEDAQRTLAALLRRRATRGPVLRMLLRGGRPTLDE